MIICKGAQKMSILDELTWRDVREQYDVRLQVHLRITRLFDAAEPNAFFELAMGISDAAGNYSASEHGLGPQVRAENLNAERGVYALAGRFRQLDNAGEVPGLIRAAQLRKL